MDAGAMGALPTRDELFDVVLKGKQLEQTMKDRQAGGGAKSGRYKKHDTARLRCLRRVVYPRLKMGILPSATDSKMLFDMPGVYQCLRAAWRAPRARTSSGEALRGGAAARLPAPAPVPVPAPAPAAPDASPRRRTRRPGARRVASGVRRHAGRWRPGFAPPAPSAAVADDDSDDEFLAFNSGMGVRTSPQADRLDEFMAADAGYVPPPRAPLAAVRAEPTPDLRGPEFQARVRREADAAAARPEARAMLVEDEDLILAQLEASDDAEDHRARARCSSCSATTARFATRAPDRNRAELVVGRLFQSTAWSEHDERRRVADFEALDHDLRAPSGSPSGTRQTTADDERDAGASRGDASRRPCKSCPTPRPRRRRRRPAVRPARGDGGGAGGGAWDKYHANAELRAEVEKDLERLSVGGISEDHFKEPARASRMLNVLTCWASGHPRPGYRQGMHEVLALFVAALEDELAAGGAPLGPAPGGFDEGDAYALFAACMETHAALFDTGRGADAPVLKLCRAAHDAAQALLDLGPAFDAVEPQLYGLRWARLLFLREFDAEEPPALGRPLRGVRGMPPAERSLPYVVERCAVALTCAAAPVLVRDDECQQMQTLMRFRDHVDASVPRVLDITLRLVDGRGLPPARGRAAPPAPAPVLQAPVRAVAQDSRRRSEPRAGAAALKSAATAAPAFLKQTALFAGGGAPAPARAAAAGPAARAPPPPAPARAPPPPAPAADDGRDARRGPRDERGAACPRRGRGLCTPASHHRAGGAEDAWPRAAELRRSALDAIEVVGLVEHCEASLCLFAYFALGALPADCACDAAADVTRARHGVPDYEAERLPGDVVARIDAVTAMDRALYDRGQERFFKHVRQVERAAGARVLCGTTRRMPSPLAGRRRS
ncbi:hypothetical protein JL720_9402 [Aureococcus anophagefferens]|nr:hypothetical protein JL720_9402 [Aureococcus anophagefferens]